jgi:hypothetical protein
MYFTYSVLFLWAYVVTIMIRNPLIHPSSWLPDSIMRQGDVAAGL